MKNDININIRKPIANDYSIQPDCYQTEADGYPSLMCWATYGMLFVDGPDQKPIYYMRNSNRDSYRWAGVINLGDGPLAGQTSAHHKELAQAGTDVHPYGRLESEKESYGLGSEKPYSEFIFNNEQSRWVEANILDLKVTPFPYCLEAHRNSPQKMCFYHQFAQLHGTYEGKPVIGMGGFDRTFAPVGREAEVFAVGLSYIGCVYSCIREDGRRESVYCTIIDKNGYGIGYYFLEGEEPILTDEIWLEADWHHLPYAPGDPTVVFTSAIWRFGGKTIHFDGKWGAKGYTPTPRIEKLGQSHVYGSWYEGDTPYKQQMAYTWNENMECTDERVIRMGFKVAD